MKTGWQSVRLALAGFIVPFMFVYNPPLLLENVTLLSGLQVVITACTGVVLIAAAAEGYLMGRLNIPMRVLAGVGAFLLIDSGLVTDLAGLGCLAIILLGRLNIPMRVLAGVGAFLLIDSGLWTDLGGLACLAVILLAQKFVFNKKDKPEPKPA